MAYPFRRAALLDTELEQGRQGRDHRIAFGAGATEEAAYHPRAFAIAAMMDGVKPTPLGWLDDVLA
jgi:hypothetical protein